MNNCPSTAFYLPPAAPWTLFATLPSLQGTFFVANSDDKLSAVSLKCGATSMINSGLTGEQIRMYSIEGRLARHTQHRLAAPRVFIGQATDECIP